MKAILLLVAAWLLASPAADDVKASDVLARMAAQNASLRSYKVGVDFAIGLRKPLPWSFGLHGTYYSKKPDKAEMVFDSVPALAQNFQRFYASIGSAQTWPVTYDITLERATHSAAGDRYVLKLVPKKEGNIDHVLLSVDGADYSLVRGEWYYRNGGTIVMDQQNQRVESYYLPKRQVAEFKLPSYEAHVQSEFGTYDLNANIPDSVFTSN